MRDQLPQNSSDKSEILAQGQERLRLAARIVEDVAFDLAKVTSAETVANLISMSAVLSEYRPEALCTPPRLANEDIAAE